MRTAIEEAAAETAINQRWNPMNLIHSIASPAWTSGFRAITSRCESCNRSLALRQVAVQKAGIRMHGCWYCSSLCLTSAAEKKFSDLLMSGQERSNRLTRMPLGLILIRRGSLTSEQLKESTDIQKQTGGEIGEILVRQGFLNEKQVTAVRAEQWGCPVFSVPNHAILTGIKIPSTLIQLYSAIPLHHVAATNSLLVGFVYGIEYGLLYAIEQMTGCKTQPCFVTPSEFQGQVQHITRSLEQCGEETPREVKFEGVENPAELARILCNYCVDFEADEATIRRCREYLWARLKCGPKEFDLLFKAD